MPYFKSFLSNSKIQDSEGFFKFQLSDASDMISICIPVYNFDINQLVNSLRTQADQNKQIVQIIIIDDASDFSYKELNEKIAKQEIYIKLKKNIGRAKIRNLFLEYANYEYLLFLDCDSLVISENFITNYIEELQKKDINVICGGRIYQKKKPERRKYLRWKYGKKIESKSAKERKIEPNKSFMTNNFLIKKELLNKIKFDENLTQYGHEDTLFGFSLKEHNIKIKHIENPILNNHLEDNLEYIEKTKLAINNLIAIIKSDNYDKKIVEDIALLKFYYSIRERKLYFYFIKMINILFSPFFFLLLKSGIIIHIKLFNFYKLGIFLKHFKK